MANVDTAAIIGQPVQQLNPLQTLSGWQNYANSVAQNAQIKASTAQTLNQTENATQDQTQKRFVWQGQKALAAASLPLDQQTPELYQSIVQNGVETGNINPTEAKQYMAAINQAGGDPQKLQQLGILHGKSTLDATAQFAANAGPTQVINTGGKTRLIRQPSPSALTANPDAAPAQVGEIRNSVAPQYVNGGDAEIPVGGDNPTPVITRGTSPEQANALRDYIDPNTGMAGFGRDRQLGGIAQSGYANGQSQAGPGQVNQTPPPGGYRLPGSGTQTPQPGGPMGTGGPGQGGLLEHGPVLYNKEAIKSQTDTYNTFKDVRDAQPLLKTSEQTLLRVHQELQNVTTGPGTDVLQKYRNYISTLNGVMGGKISATDISAGNYDELNKDLNQLVAQAGSGAKFVGNLDAITHGNPNTLMNRLANSNVTSILLGQNRQKQLEYMMTKDQNSGRDFQQARQKASDLDPRALGLGAMSDTMRAQTLAELSKNPTDYERFFRTLAIAKKAGMNLGPDAPPPVASPQPAQGITGNALQGINGQ